MTIEDDVQIGSHCSIYSVSTIDGKEGEVVLKKHCRIGSHSVVMPGVTIGENAVVGAMSFVNCDIPNNCVAVGVPAKRIKFAPQRNSLRIPRGKDYADLSASGGLTQMVMTNKKRENLSCSASQEH